MLQLSLGLTILLLTLATPAYAEQTFVEGSLLLTTAVLCLIGLALLLTLSSLSRCNKRLLRQQRSFKQLLAETPGIIAVLDKNLLLRNASTSLKSLLQVQDHSTLALALPLYADAEGSVSLDSTLKSQLRQHGVWHGEVWLKTERHAEAYKISIHALATESVKGPFYLLYGQNITQLRQQNERQQQLQVRDDLTLLPNPFIFEEHLRQALLSCDERYPSVALMFLRLHDSSLAQHPEQLTDARLSEVAERLQTLVPSKFLLARQPGANFSILIPPHLCLYNNNIILNQLAHKVISGFNQQDAQGTRSPLRVYIGISISPNDGEDVSSLLSSAEKAAGRAAQQAESALCFADSASQQQAPDLLALEGELYRSAAQGEFELYYQPKFSISSNRIVGFEALLRWPSPRRGMLPPPTFLPVVEETGLIISLDRLVFRKACQQVSHWQQTGLMRGRLALNISAQQFAQKDFLRFMQDTLAEFELTASLFELELSETIFGHPTIWLRERMNSLERLGFRLILDNFGEGVSSLTQLRQFPFNGVKLAPSLVRYVEQQEQQRNICATLIRLAGYLELDVTATNIETEMQAYLLHVMGCDCQQGHRFSRAIPAEDIGQLLLKENQLLNNQRQIAN
jgi:diguanylate cyclase (GGDEF)-like protein